MSAEKLFADLSMSKFATAQIPKTTKGWKKAALEKTPNRWSEGSTLPLRGLPQIDFVRMHGVHRQERRKSSPSQSISGASFWRIGKTDTNLGQFSTQKTLLHPAEDLGSRGLHKRSETSWHKARTKPLTPSQEGYQGRREVCTTLFPDSHPRLLNREAHIAHEGWGASPK